MPLILSCAAQAGFNNITKKKKKQPRDSLSESIPMLHRLKLMQPVQHGCPWCQGQVCVTCEIEKGPFCCSVT